MKTKLKWVMTLLFLFNVLWSFSQVKEVTGIVSDDTGPLPGVTVVIKGTTLGTETDFDGRYRVKIKVGDVLVFSFVGMHTQEQIIGSSNIINVKLENDNVLNEVVVIGFGTQTKRKLTDNVVSLGAKDIADVPTPNVLNSLSSKASGVQIRQANGKIEGGLSFRIRGQSSIGAGSNPLYVIDGIPIINADESNNSAPTNPLITLNPNEIESIDILKDASSASIYGARGANGVVVITTKNGENGKASFSLNISTGISEASNKRDWLNAKEYVELLLEAGENSSWASSDYVPNRLDRYSNGTDWRNAEIDTDWQDIALRRGYVNDINFSVNGGNEKTKYFFSTSYNDTKGIVLGNDLERIGGRVNVKHTFHDKLTLGANLSFSRAAINRVSSDNDFTTPLQAIAQAPISPAYDENGEPFSGTTYANFLLEDKYAFYKTIISRVLGILSGQYKIMNNLSFNSNFGYDLYQQTEDNFRGRKTPYMSTNGSAFASNVNTESYNFSNYISYDWKHNDHSLNAILGMEFNEINRRYTDAEGIEFPVGTFNTINGASAIISANGSVTKSNFLSYFTRLTYALRDTYLVKASIRRDGSSRFGKESRFGNFASLSAGWILSNESFLSDTKFLSFLKLRASYGTLGNAEIGGNFRSLNRVASAGYNKSAGTQLSQAGDSSLQWESSNQLDLGVEYAILNNRVSGRISYYNKDTDDLIFQRNIPGSSGLTSITQNIGRLASNGIELELTTKNIQNDKFKWTTNFNLGQNVNEIKSLPSNNTDQIFGNNILRVGEAVNSHFLIEYAGVDPANGDALYYKNTNNNGVLDRSTTNDASEAERIVAGNPNPVWVGGLTNTITYNNFDLSLTFGGEWGASIYNDAGRFQSANGEWFDNQTKDQLNRWQNPGDITNVPQARLGDGNGTNPSTRWLESGDFIRLRNFTLGYKLPYDFIKKSKLESVRLYFSGLNLFTITDFTGYDPESRYDATGADPGSVFYSAPAARTYSFGVNIKF